MNSISNSRKIVKKIKDLKTFIMPVSLVNIVFYSKSKEHQIGIKIETIPDKKFKNLNFISKLSRNTFIYEVDNEYVLQFFAFLLEIAIFQSQKSMQTQSREQV